MILEAKIRIGDDKKAAAQHAASILALECSSDDEERRYQILHVEKNIGQMLSDVELGAVSRATNGETFDALKTQQAVHKADTWSRLCFKKKHRPVMDGFFLFKFNRQSILDEGPWFVYGRPLILRRWTEDITMYRENLEANPVWVRLSNLNFCFQTNSALSKIASVIGNPICMDHATASGNRYAFLLEPVLKLMLNTPLNCA